MGLKEDTALAVDLGLSGSLGGVPSPGRSATGSGSGLSGLSGMSQSSAGTRGGVNVLGPDDSQADPMAQTNISQGVNDSLSMEGGVGSGSGLLDLTRESDDTSLGAELLDEITPGGGRRPAPAGDSEIGAGVTASAATPGRGRAMAVQVEQADAMAPAFAGAAIAAIAFILYGAIVLASAVMHTKPGLIDLTSGKQFIMVAAIGLVAAVVLFIVGLFIGKATT